ncbi:MAG: T9SS type A sorting domain-containing protein, partial [Candidatus Kapaibacterium sp.]
FGKQTGVEQYSINTINIYPNPAKEQVNFDILGPKNISVYDINGRAILELSTTETSLNISDFPTGKFIIEINSNSEFYRGTFIK